MVDMGKIDRRYIITYLCCCLFIFGIGLNNAYSVFIVPLSDLLDTGRGTITLASTIADLICSFLSPVLVTLLNRTALRKLLFFSTLLYALATVGIGLIPTLSVFYLLNIMKGFITVVYSVNVIIILLGNWFEKGRDMLTGIALAFTGVGGAIFSQIFSRIIERFGVSQAFVFFGVMSFVLSFPAIVLLKLKPEEAGLSILKDERIEEKKEEREESDIAFRYSDPRFIGLSAVFFIAIFITNVSIHFPGYAETRGFGAYGASMVSAMMLGSIMFKIVVGYICDRFGPRSGFPFLIVMEFIAVSVVLFAENGMVMVAGSFVFGVSLSSLIALSPLIRYCYSDELYPVVFSRIMVISALSNLGGPLTGYLYDFTGTYTASLYGSLILCALAMAVFVFTMNTAGKSR